mgnify:CR=1 FL=1
MFQPLRIAVFVWTCDLNSLRPLLAEILFVYFLAIKRLLFGFGEIMIGLEILGGVVARLGTLSEEGLAAI